jgi:hypothetical protein
MWYLPMNIPPLFIFHAGQCNTTIPTLKQCGGMSASCGKNATCPGFCCTAGNACRYVTQLFWRCQPLASAVPPPGGGCWRCHAKCTVHLRCCPAAAHLHLPAAATAVYGSLRSHAPRLVSCSTCTDASAGLSTGRLLTSVAQPHMA